MNRVRARLPGFCMSRAVARVRVRDRSHPQLQNNKTYSSIKTDEFSSKNSSELNFTGDDDDMLKAECEFRNRVMVVVDSSLEAKAALQWALSHTVQNQDSIILLYVTKPSKQDGNSNMELTQRAYELLCSMKNMCQMKRPGVKVEIAMQEGKIKGPTIVEEAKKQRVSLLVLGQRKPSILWRLQEIWAAKRTHGGGAVDYCIQNANCMTISVRRKSRKHGGYLITTKRHKDFWLLA